MSREVRESLEEADADIAKRLAILRNDEYLVTIPDIKYVQEEWVLVQASRAKVSRSDPLLCAIASQKVARSCAYPLEFGKCLDPESGLKHTQPYRPPRSSPCSNAATPRLTPESLL